jgi:hypothetical protein
VLTRMGLDDGVQRAATKWATGPADRPRPIRNFGSCAFIPRIVLHVNLNLHIAFKMLPPTCIRSATPYKI